MRGKLGSGSLWKERVPMKPIDNISIFCDCSEQKSIKEVLYETLLRTYPPVHYRCSVESVQLKHNIPDPYTTGFP